MVRTTLRRPGGRVSSGCRCLFRTDPAKSESFQQIYKSARRARIRRFPYVAYFVSTATGIQIVACMHAKRDPRIWQQRVDR